MKCSALSSDSSSRVTRVYSSAGQVRTATIWLACANRGSRGKTSNVEAAAMRLRRVCWQGVLGGAERCFFAMFFLFKRSGVQQMQTIPPLRGVKTTAARRKEKNGFFTRGTGLHLNGLGQRKWSKRY